MRKYVKYILIFVAFLIFIVGIIFLVFGDFRHNIFRVVAETPGIAYYFRLRPTIFHRNFHQSSKILESQLDLVMNFSSNQSVFLPGLIANTKYVLNEVSKQEEYEIFIKYLKKLVKYKPNIFLPKIWLAEATVNFDPKLSLKTATDAMSLIPSDDRPYKLAINAALNLSDYTTINNLCSSYKKSDIGSLIVSLLS